MFLQDLSATTEDPEFLQDFSFSAEIQTLPLPY